MKPLHDFCLQQLKHMGLATMTEKKTELTSQEYLMALGLFTLGQKSYMKGCEYEDGLAAVLGREGRNDIGHLSDAIYSSDPTFDEALKREGFTVLPE